MRLILFVAVTSAALAQSVMIPGPGTHASTGTVTFSPVAANFGYGVGVGATASIGSTDCSGANAYFVWVSAGNANTATVSDNSGHTFTLISTVTGTGNRYVQYSGSGGKGTWWYAVNITGSATETFTVVGDYPSVEVLCVSRSSGTWVEDVNHGTDDCTSPTSCTGGSTSPTASPSMVLSGLQWSYGAVGVVTHVGAGFNILHQFQIAVGDYYGSSAAYLIQSSSTAVDPSWDNVNFGAVLNVAFK